MGTAVTISTPRASEDFTHDLAYSFVGGSYVTIATGVQTSHKWTTPDLASKIPNAASGTLTIRCITKNGSATIGTKTVTMSLVVPASVVPTISTVSVTEATEGLAAQFGAFIKGKSAVKATITAAGVKGSTIKSYSTTLNGKVYSGASWTSELLTASGTLNLVTTVTDSRGRSTKKTTSISVLDYNAPMVNALQVYRVNADGGAEQEGQYLAVRYKYSVQSLNDKNTAQMLIEYKRTTEEYWEDLLSSTALSGDTTALPTSPTFSTDYQYDIRITVTDWFGATGSHAAVLPSSEVIMDFAADGKGVAIGTTAQHPGFEVKWKARMTGGYSVLSLPDGTDLDTLTTPNTFAGAAFSGYVHCPAPDRDFTLEVLPAGAEGQLMQRLTTCVPLAPIVYARFYVSEAWQAWAIIGFESIWQGATLSSSFRLYDANQAVQYRRSGGVVEIKGVVKPASAISYDDGWVTITTLPEGYRPGGLTEVNRVCQGGGNCIWLLRVTLSGDVQFARYRDGSTATEAGTDARLPFSIIFLANR
jgi:hypothetical protein